MTQEDKELLLRDLCARLPYGVKIELMPITKGKCVTLTPIILQDYFISDDVNYLPYLRPMSSMTEEELKAFYKIEDMEHPVIWNIPQPNWHFSVEGIDWLLSKQFDFRGLIEKSLAIKAPKGMYNLK